MQHGRSGQIKKHKPICFCGEIGSYYEEYDSYFCKTGNVWLEPTCSEELCKYCNHRPTKPIQD